MQEQNMTALMQSALKEGLLKPRFVEKQIGLLADKNKKDLAKKELPDYLRTPTAEELIEMRQWAIDYKKGNKQASKREVRKATQEHFHIRIFR